jgi:hypothetical protein
MLYVYHSLLYYCKTNCYKCYYINCDGKWWTLLGAVNNTFLPTFGQTEPGLFPAPRPGECVPAGVCACVLPYRGVPRLPFESVFLNGWVRERVQASSSLFLTVESLPLLCFFRQTGLF